MTYHPSHRLPTRKQRACQSSGFVLITLLLVMLMIAITVTITMKGKGDHNEDLMAQKESQQIHQINNGFFNYCQNNDCSPWPDLTSLTSDDLNPYFSSLLLTTTNTEGGDLTFTTLLGDVTASIESSNQGDDDGCQGNDGDTSCKHDLLRLTLASDDNSSSRIHTLQKTASLLPNSNVTIGDESKPTLTTQTINLDTLNNNLVNVTITSIESGDTASKPSCAEPYTTPVIHATPISCVGIDPLQEGKYGSTSVSYPLQGCRINVQDNGDSSWKVLTEVLTTQNSTKWNEGTTSDASSGAQNWIRVITGCANKEGA